MQDSLKKIPMAAWNWLGVNEVTLPAEVSPLRDEEKNIAVTENQREKSILVSRGGESQKVNIEVAEGATLFLSAVKLGEEAAERSVKVTVSKGGRIVVALLATGGNFASGLDIDLAGDGAKAEVHAFYFGTGKEKIDLNYIIRQRGKNTRAEMNVKGALGGSCDKIFRGTLDFVEGSEGSEGRENEEVIILSDKARNRSVPLMLSHEKAVDGHHGVSVGRIDEEKLFYMMSRGLDERQAKNILIEAAALPALEKIDDDALKDEIKAAVTEKISHEYRNIE